MKPMHPNEARVEVRKLIERLSNDEVHVLCVQALRNWHSRLKPQVWPEAHYEPVDETFQLHDQFGRELLPLIADKRSASVTDIDALKESFIDALGYTWMRGVMEFLWWLQRAGLAVETQRGKSGYPIAMRMTARGLRFLAATDDDPLLPGFLDRIRARCKDLPDGVLALLVDARACLDHGLHRPAVVLMGVAYELAIEHVVDKLEPLRLLDAKTTKEKPKEKINRILALIRDVPKVKGRLPSSDERTTAERAYDFADTLRDRRNEAAHTTPRYDFSHREETTEFLISASRHLPGLWLLMRDPS